MRRLAGILALLAAAVVVGGFLGRFAAPLDALSLVRMPAAAVLLVLALGLAGWGRAAAVGLAAVALAGWVRLDFGAEASAPDLRLYQKNTYFANRDGAALVADILGSGADVVTLQELSSRNRAIVDGLRAAYPYSHACTYRGWAVAILSKLPDVAGSAACAPGRGMALMQLQSRNGPVWIAAVHVPWPWPHGGWQRAAQLAALLEPLSRPVVVAGDFNLVPWSHAVAGFARASGSAVIGPARGTLHVDLWGLARGRNEWTGLTGKPVFGRHVPMPIDQVLAPAGRVAKRPLLGSDHSGLLADIWLGDKG